MARKETFEKVAKAINNRLKNPSDKMMLTIYRRTFDAGLISRKWHHKPIHYCSECGNQVHNLSLKECPHCHVKWKAKPEHYERRQARYHMVLDAKGDIQVCRFYRVERYTRFGQKSSTYVWEVERIMYAPNGERKVFARGVHGLSMYYDAFSFCSPITIRREGKYMSQSATFRYNLSVDSFYIKSLTQQWRYKDIHAMLSNYDNDTSVLRVIAHPYGETLLKTGQKPFFDYLVKHYESLPKGCEHALNICHRNHYRIDDPSLWLDHLKLLKRFRLDTHNAHYVCPADLREAHQVLLERKRRDEERRSAELRAIAEQERMERDKAYADMMQHWADRMGAILGLSLSGDNLTVKPLQSIDEFKKEGEAMHHCVYVMKYYDFTRHPYSLILSAKDGAGHRLATIEYNTARHDIVQCRAACNQVPERDKEIRDLITSHRKDIERLLKAKEVSTKATKKKTAAVVAA
ncbi:MAG: PcfJ domain-containing protein [Prevotella sp.]|nr:PcfJ domain-containing protein [Prevotella sp.]